MSNPQIAALLTELTRQQIQGRTDRIAAIKIELSALGHEIVDEPPAVEYAVVNDANTEARDVPAPAVPVAPPAALDTGTV